MASSALNFDPVKLAASEKEFTKAIGAASVRFEELARGMAERLPSNPETMLDSEEEFHRAVARECISPVVGATIRVALLSPAVVERAAAIAAATPYLRLQHGKQVVRIACLGGADFIVETPYFLIRPRGGSGNNRRRGERGPDGNGRYPRLAALGIQFGATPALVSEVAKLAAQGVLQQAVDTLASRGVDFDAKGVSRLAQRLAERGLDFRDYLFERAKAGYWRGGQAKGKRLAVCMDGGRVRIRIPDVGPPKKSGWHGFTPEWWEPKILVVYEVDAKGRRVKNGLLRYEATLALVDGFCETMTALLLDLGADEAESWFILGDGAPWIAQRVPKLIADVGFDLSRVVTVLDFYHATEHVHEFADAVKGWDAAKAKEWARTAVALLRRGGIDAFIAEATSLCTDLNEGLVDKLDYFVERRSYMNYARYEECGIPLGSGAVESAVRRIVNLRLKGNGITWREANAEGMLHLRAQLLCGQWRALVTTVLDDTTFWLHDAVHHDRKAVV